MSGLVQSRALVTSNVSTANSSTTPLAAAGSFAGAWVPAGGYTTVLVTCFTDAPGQVAVSWSADRVNADLVQAYSVSANTFFSQRLPVSGVYVKTSYTNGPAAAQTVFRLTTILTTANDGAEVSVNLTNGDVVSVQGVDITNTPRTLSTTANGTVNTRDSVIANCVDFGSNAVQVSVVADSTHAQATAASTASISGQLPPALGQQASGSSLSITPASGATFPVADSGAASLLTDLVEQGNNLSLISDGISDVKATLTSRLPLGALATGSCLGVVASANGFVVSGLNTSNEPVNIAATDAGLLRVSIEADSTHAQSTATSTANISSQLPSALGQTTKAASLSVAVASDQVVLVAGQSGLGATVPLFVDNGGMLQVMLADSSVNSFNGSGLKLAGLSSEAGEYVAVAADGSGRLKTAVAQLPAALGPQASGSSLSVTPASGATFAVSLAADSSVAAPNGNGVRFAAYSLADAMYVPVACDSLGHLKTLDQSVVAAVDAANQNAIKVSVVADSSHAQSTATSAASISAQLPPALGSQPGANSLSIVQSYDSALNVGTPQLPTVLGPTPAAGSLSIVAASDAAIPAADLFAVGRGLVAGARVIDRYAKVGARAQADRNFIDANGGAVETDSYPYPPGGPSSTLWITSDSIDDYSAGVGARTITLTYVTGTGVEASTVVSLSGTTPVAFTPNPPAFIPYIEDLVVTTCGSSGKASGTISVRKDDGSGTTPADCLGIYTSGGFQSANHFVQPGRVAFVTGARATGGGASIDIYLREVRGLPGVSNTIITRWRGQAYNTAGWSDATLSRPVMFTGPTLIHWVYNRGATTENDLSYQIVEYTL